MKNSFAFVVIMFLLSITTFCNEADSTSIVDSASNSNKVSKEILSDNTNNNLEVSTDNLLKVNRYQGKLFLNSSDIKYINDDLPPYEPLQTKVDYTLLGIVGGVYLGTGIAVHIYQRNAWWKDERSHFHFQNDWNYALWEDKMGHFFGTNILAHFFSSGLEAGNFDLESSAIYGSAAALAFELYVEIEDGFGPNWGFSPGDAYSDVLGATYSLGQYYFPVLKNFQPKFSYYPSWKYRQGLHEGNAIDDYEGQKYWVAIRMKNLLPENIGQYWPSFLNLAFGAGVKNLDGNGGGVRDLFLALDFDFEAIPLYGKGWQFIKNTFNYWHLPMPGIRLNNKVIFIGLCY